jgi:SulP family sulfate permease
MVAFGCLNRIIISALVCWEALKRIRAKKYLDDNGVKHYGIYGPLFWFDYCFAEKFDVFNDPIDNHRF